ncbi:MAG TPA: phosphate ABC transporter substrate-binding protein PstS [Candidatus Acidoferrales bacterium]|nr:phosphate ABC transporter substrate-binding protein PstS [Candidatus Acidoferrales bacterium]
MTISTTRKLAGLALAALVAACSNPAASQPAATQPSGSQPASSGPTTPVPPSASVTLQGAGATFPALLYQVWIEKFTEAYNTVQINYQGIGSGGGIKAITQQTVDFGASDAAMKDEEIAALPAGTTLLHIPTALGAVVVIFNVKGADGTAITKLNLDADTIAGIFLGHIKTWNDPALAAINPDVAANLPATPVLVVHRSDGSGTTNAFTSYLDTVNAEWHTSVGKGKEVNWPVGNGAPGNDGVSAGVKQTDGGVGYVELQYAVISGLSSAMVKNAAGKFVAGSSDGVTAAAEGALSTFPADFRQAPIINGAGDATYPIASYTYLLVYANQTDATKGQALVAFLYWALTDGQNEEKAIGYAPLPDAVRLKALEELHQITAGGTAIWP